LVEWFQLDWRSLAERFGGNAFLPDVDGLRMRGEPTDGELWRE
jgi:hypothetical protein